MSVKVRRTLPQPLSYLYCRCSCNGKENMFLKSCVGSGSWIQMFTRAGCLEIHLLFISCYFLGLTYLKEMHNCESWILPYTYEHDDLFNRVSSDLIILFDNHCIFLHMCFIFICLDLKGVNRAHVGNIPNIFCVKRAGRFAKFIFRVGVFVDIMLKGVLKERFYEL